MHGMHRGMLLDHAAPRPICITCRRLLDKQVHCILLFAKTPPLSCSCTPLCALRWLTARPTLNPATAHLCDAGRRHRGALLRGFRRGPGALRADDQLGLLRGRQALPEGAAGAQRCWYGQEMDGHKAFGLRFVLPGTCKNTNRAHFDGQFVVWPCIQAHLHSLLRTASGGREQCHEGQRRQRLHCITDPCVAAATFRVSPTVPPCTAARRR